MKAPIKCEGSGTKSHVSDLSVMDKQATCPVCHKKVKITIPDKDMHGNVAKFSSHSKGK